MPPKKGRGGNNGNNGNGGKQKQQQKQTQKQQNRVCSPGVSELPTQLIPIPRDEGVPACIQEKLDEFWNFQTFFSIMERIAPEVATHSRMSSCWFGVEGSKIESFERNASDDTGFTGTLTYSGKEYPLFLKRAHILDPLDCIEGECVWPKDGSLPSPYEQWLTAIEKITEPMNEAYVDALFATLADRMVVAGISPHWLRCFGTFTARVDKYVYDITEEYPSLRRKSFWDRHQTLGMFRLKKVKSEDGESEEEKPVIGINADETELSLDDFLEVEEVAVAKVAEATPATGESAEIEVDSMSEVATLTPAAVRIRKLEESPTSSSGSSGSSGSSAGSSEEDDEYVDYYAEFDNFPVQVSLLERAEGTLDELLDQETTLDAAAELRWTAWVFQIIAGLAAAQHMFGFVHNDLHTNNVMWVNTEEPFLYYRVHPKTGGGPSPKAVVYKVPTYGRIMKIIDFGRASFILPEQCGGTYISDAFFPGNDAGYQYNCEPFFDAKAGKRVEPNPSFDLSRLAVSMLEALYPTRPTNATPIKIIGRDGNKTFAETVSPLYNLIWEWLIDDAGKSVLREPNGKERYPGFELYPAIAAEVHNAIPAQQLEKSVFSKVFKCTTHDIGPASIYDLWVR